MMKKLLPIVLVLLGIGGGVGAGLVLKPELPVEDTVLEETDPCGDVQPASSVAKRPVADPVTREYVRLNNQFIVPVVQKERIDALVVLSLSIEIAKGRSQTVFDREPKLRDEFLQVLFNHANMGGFQGAFTETATMAILRRNLLEAGQSILGDAVSDILITDIARQDV